VRPLRDNTPGKTYLVSIRTDNSFLRLIPSEELNEIVGGVFAKYQEIFNITLHALIVLSNHYHLLAQAPLGNLSEFAENVNREIAKRINRLLRRNGHFWGRRYDALVVIEEVDALEGLLYILTNPVHHGLIKDPALWPGISSYFQCLGRPNKSYLFTNWTEYGKAKQRAFYTGEMVRIRDFQTEHTLVITPLQQFSHLSVEERADKIKSLVEVRCKEIDEKRVKEGKTCYLGRKKILRQSPNDSPQESSKKVRPWFYTKNPTALREAIIQERLRRAEYQDASCAFRFGIYFVTFPLYTYPPPSHRKPKHYKPPPGLWQRYQELQEFMAA
jgi:hypothetical protein